jgi:hypothetical protein
MVTSIMARHSTGWSAYTDNGYVYAINPYTFYRELHKPWEVVDVYIWQANISYNQSVTG